MLIDVLFFDNFSFLFQLFQPSTWEYGYGTGNEEEKAILEFVLLFISSDTYFKKRNHTFVSGGNFSQIVVILCKSQKTR